LHKPDADSHAHHATTVEALRTYRKERYHIIVSVVG
jgi:hypothetical protein